ncbi:MULTISPECIES: class A beta-lactamase [unclassified Marinobacter]|uniref:class A beta-lactamase n=1 Tax=unclassified Marinobacter TaxID=83889 RepID=UPI0019277514|nr:MULTISPECIES: class A beta-lactamase [unclassified Marinobacter]MBL3827130.1 class A beta-lactamase [Marinobacter sp. MC3]MBL3895645.1 class A beta-lactamase [Marinobacter sp. MW3]
MKRNIATFLIVIASLFFAVQPAFSEEHNVKDVPQKLEKLSEGLVGRLGVAAQEIGSGVSVTVNGDESFVMASTYKVAIAVALLDRVDQGQIKLSDLIDLPQEEMVVGTNAIAETYVHPGVQFSVANLIEVMITESDNTATDFSLELAGGPEAVTKKLRSLGITDQRVDRSTSEILRDFYGLPDKAYFPVVTKAVADDPSLLLKMTQPNMAFEKDPRDHSTPKAMLQLLLAIDAGTAMSAESSKFLLGVMSRTRTGAGRLKGLLPKGAPVAHKTGTIGGVANDVGFITLPDGRRFAIAVFTNSSTTSTADQDRAIAEISRSLYDLYYLTPQSK